MIKSQGFHGVPGNRTPWASVGIAKVTPLARLGEPEDTGATVAFLCAPGAVESNPSALCWVDVRWKIGIIMRI